MEVSLVSVPANPNALAVAKSLNISPRTLRKVFGEHAAKLAVSSTKPMYGHSLGAAGAIEAIICFKAMEEGWVPPTLGIESSDPECDLDYVAKSGRQRKVTYAMSNCLRFSGLNSALIFGPPPA